MNKESIKEHGIKHEFNLKGDKVDDKFLGCTNCWFRHDIGTGTCDISCPKCGETMNILTITNYDSDLL